MGRAVQYREPGVPSVLVVREVPDEEPRPGTVRIRTKAVSLNPFDAKVRSGLIGPAPVGEWRDVATDFAGVVDAVGEGASYADGSAVTLGHPVFGANETGVLRETFVCGADRLARKPASVPWEVAATIARPAVTARAALEELSIGSGDVVLVSAAAGAVGTIYSQLALQRGARVIGTASPRNHPRLARLGVTPVEYGPGLAERVRAAAGGDVTAVQDCHGGETIDAALELGVPVDRICTIVDYRAKAERGIRMPTRYEHTPARLEEFAGLVADGRLEITVVPPLPLERARKAFELLESGHAAGNVVIRTDR
jgi:NADPH:quinone reductase-like Zn-dependent oxidoreductase